MNPDLLMALAMIAAAIAIYACGRVLLSGRPVRVIARWRAAKGIQREIDALPPLPLPERKTLPFVKTARGYAIDFSRRTH